MVRSLVVGQENEGKYWPLIFFLTSKGYSITETRDGLGNQIGIEQLIK